ncbi:hypothetical protein D3C71_796310 [compost metagenome]
MKFAKYTYYFLLLIPVQLLGQIKSTLLPESPDFHASVSTISSVAYGRMIGSAEYPVVLLRKSISTYDSAGCTINRNVYDYKSPAFEVSCTCITTDTTLIHLTKNKSGDTIFFSVFSEISPLETTTYNKTQEHQFYSREFFDTLGRIIYMKSISNFVKSKLEDGSRQEHFYTYDTSGNLTKSISINDTGNGDEKLIETKEYAYDTLGNKIHEQLLKADNLPLYNYVYTYNELNQLTSKALHSTHYPPWTERFFYNKQGDIIRKIMDRPQEKKHVVTKIIYKYDFRGNWVYREELVDGLLIRKETRQFEYYN